MAGHHAVTELTLRAAVAQRLGPARYGLWFGEGIRLGVADDALEIGVPNAFFREWIQAHFAGNLLDAAREVTGRSLRLTFRITDEAPPPVEPRSEPASPEDHRAGPGGPPPEASAPPTPRLLPPNRLRPPNRPPRRLEDFVTGPCNRLAHAAAREVVQAGGASFNPLVIHGGVGLGKTHLLEGIGHAWRTRHPGQRVVQGTAEAFTNSFLEALRTGALGAFRARYRGADALILDDVHFLAAKRATHEEFLHTFNVLSGEGVPIVLTADQHPRRIAQLSDELATRLLGGMVVQLEPPDLTTRRAILQAKAATRGVGVPDAVLQYLAEHLRGSVRELEGALHSVVAQAVLTGQRLDLSLARSALRDTLRHTAPAVGLREVERAVCHLFAVAAEALKSESRARALSYPRMLGMYLARKHTGAAYSEIGRFFGGRNHSTVIAAEKRVAAWLRAEERCALLAGFETVADVLAALERALGAS